MKQAPLQFREMLRRLRDSEGEPLTRLLLSFSAALAATAALFGLAWLIALVFPQWTAIPRFPAGDSERNGHDALVARP
ncbi:MAG: hypothetical protein HZB38_01990 [Planctomycetes bacterium]|nr:hypothetical protein [Planctomycetota bacterium]